MRVRGVFFDLYGTLLVYGDMRAAWDAWLTTLHGGFAERGLTMPREAFALCCDGFFARAEPPDRRDGATVLERRLRALCDEFDLDATGAALREIGEAAVEAWQDHVTLDPEARPVLEALRQRYTLALVSNFDHAPHVHRVLARCGWAGAFDTIVVSAEAGVKKPDPRIFRIALERGDLDPREVIHVGDSDDDVQGARAAAIRPILIRRGRESDAGPLLDFHATDGGRGQAFPTDPDVPVIGRLSDLLAMLEA